MAKYFAGIGSRQTPRAYEPIMKSISERLTALGWILRSGRASGADTFFESGAGSAAQIFVAKGNHGTTARRARIIVPSGELLAQCELLASVVHPAWGACNEYARLSHARNMCQVFGERLDEPARVVIAWAPPDAQRCGEVLGGTATAWRAAGWAGIRRYNLYFPDQLNALEDALKKLQPAA